MASILIIEDEISIAELERDYLELSGFEVEIETSGTSGLERALKEDFNLIILDLMLPGIDGFDICKKIREHKNTPIIMVSAKKDDIDFQGFCLQLNAGVQNIFNSYQKDFDKGASRDSGYIYGPGAPRSYFAGVKLSF